MDETEARTSTPPGWYPHPVEAPTVQRYWDGSRWTDDVAPLGAAPQPRSNGLSIWTIAIGVALGVVAVIVGLVVINGFADENETDDLIACVSRNNELREQGEPTYPCD